jgi:hypothetical protein
MKTIQINSKVSISTNNTKTGKAYQFNIAQAMSGDAFAAFKIKYEHQIAAAIVELGFEEEIAVEAIELPENVEINDEDRKFMLCFNCENKKWVYSLPLKSLYFTTINLALAAYYHNLQQDLANGNNVSYKIAMFYNALPSSN